MPIRPENRDRYPADWPTISRGIKDRAGWRCECTGDRPYVHLDIDERCRNRHNEPAYGCDEDNLKAMCQGGCHLHYDRAHHAETRAATRRAETAVLAGLFDLDENRRWSLVPLCVCYTSLALKHNP